MTTKPFWRPTDLFATDAHGAIMHKQCDCLARASGPRFVVTVDESDPTCRRWVSTYHELVCDACGTPWTYQP